MFYYHKKKQNYFPIFGINESENVLSIVRSIDAKKNRIPIVINNRISGTKSAGVDLCMK